MRLIMLGPPGAGKGTQAIKIAQSAKVPQISTGDLFRKAMSENTPLGVKAKGYIDKGELVPDEITLEMIKERLHQDDAKAGFILDGFPRTVRQAEELDNLLAKMGISLDAVVEIQIDPQILIERLENRRTCPTCGTIYNLLVTPPASEGVCDTCSVPLVQRSDDRREVIENRINVYHEKTGPLSDYYKKKGLLVGINGDQAPQEVTSEIYRKLKMPSAI